MRRFVLALASVLTLLAAFGGDPAAADPVNNPNAHLFEVTCSNGETLTLIGTDPSAVALVTDDTRVTILHHLSVVDLASGETVFTASVGRGQKTGVQGDLVTCVTSFTDPATGAEMELRAVVFITPRGR